MHAMLGMYISTISALELHVEAGVALISMHESLVAADDNDT